MENIVNTGSQNTGSDQIRPQALRIGALVIDPPLLLAPMAGVTDVPYRRLMAEFGAGMVTTEMVSVEGLYRGQKGSWKLVDLDSRVGVPTAVQLFGCDPEKMAEVAARVEQKGARLIDINAGCPVKKVSRQGAGAILLKDLQRLAKMVEKVRQNVSIPVTVKIRLGWDKASINVLDVVRRLESAGAQAITLHARTAVEFYRGRADWNWISKVKKIMDIPLIGNGDVVSAQLADRMLSETGCDAVMIGRASLGNPWLMMAIASGWGRCLPHQPPLDWATFLSTVYRHLTEFEDQRPSPPGHFRKLLLWYSKGIPRSAQLRAELTDIRDKQLMLDRFHAWVERLDNAGISFVQCKIPGTKLLNDGENDQ